MKSLSKTDLSFYLFLVFSATLPFAVSLSNFALAAVVISLFLQAKQSNLSGFKQEKLSLLVAAFFSLHLIGLIYSDNLTYGLFNIEKKLSLLLLPMAFILAKPHLDKTKLKSILVAFLTGITISSSIILFIAFFRHITLPSFNLDLFFRTEAINFIQLHPSYFTLYSGFGVLIAINYLFNHSILGKLLLITSIIVNLLVMFFLAARMPLLACFISFLVLGFLQLKTKKAFIAFAAGVILLLSAGYLAYQSSPALKRRFREISETKLAPPVGIHHNSTNLRVAQMICTLDILKENWLLGLGTGDYQDHLNNCYETNGWSEVLYKKSFNPHNQFLETWLALGLPGLISLITILVYGMYNGFKKKDPLFLSFLVLFTLCCMTESMLEKNKGIFFFIFFLLLQSHASIIKPSNKKGDSFLDPVEAKVI